MNSREPKNTTNPKTFILTFLLFFVPFILISSAIFFFNPYLQRRSISEGCARLFEQRAFDFFREGGLSRFLEMSEDSTGPHHLEEFDIVGLYLWEGHWVNIYSCDDFFRAKFNNTYIAKNFSKKHGIYFWKGNLRAVKSDQGVFFAAEPRGDKLYLLSAKFKPEFSSFIGVIPEHSLNHIIADILSLVAFCTVLALAFTFILAAFIQNYSLKISRSTASAKFELPSAPYLGLNEIGNLAVESAKSAYEARQQRRNILLQKQTEFETERRDFSIIREIAQAAVSAPDLHTAASESLIPLLRRTGARCAAIYKHHNSMHLRMIGEKNLPADLAIALSDFEAISANFELPSEGFKIDTIPIQELSSEAGNPIQSLRDEGPTHAHRIALNIKGELWGIIHLYSTGLNFLDERTQNLLLAAADEIALILQNKELLAQLDGRIKEGLSYYDFSKTLIAVNEFDMLLENILWLVHETLDVPFCSVLLGDDEEQMLYVRAMWGYGQEHKNMKLPYGKGLTGWAVLNGEAALAKDVSKDPRYLEGFEWVTSELAVPLIADAKVIGVLDCESNETHQLDESDLRFLSMVAEPAALSIRRAQLFTEMSRQLVLDPVTKLYNRRYFDNLIDTNGEELLLRHGKVSVAFISISNLGEINNTYGYVAGDLIVKQAAKMLTSLFPEGIISRYGLSEFLVLLPGIGEEAMLRMVEELRILREEWMNDHPDAIPITFSQGFATTNRYDELRNLVYRADSEAAHYRRQNGNIGNF